MPDPSTVWSLCDRTGPILVKPALSLGNSFPTLGNEFSFLFLILWHAESFSSFSHLRVHLCFILSFSQSAIYWAPPTAKHCWRCSRWSRSVVSDSLRPYGLSPTRLLHPWNFPGQSTGVGCHFLLQGIFLTQGLNPGLLHCRQILNWLSHQGSPHLVYHTC